jgi:transketolase
MSEGSQWEALALAAHYGLDNLVGVLDVNRLGQRGETMFGHDLAAYQARIDAFGWKTIVIEMYVAEQNMVGVALCLSCRGKIPFVSTFAAFLTRVFDQIRMAHYSNGNIKFVGSHAGVSIGADGPSQMGLEDIAMFRILLDGVVLHPCDAISTERLGEIATKVEEMCSHAP